MYWGVIDDVRFLIELVNVWNVVIVGEGIDVRICYIYLFIFKCRIFMFMGDDIMFVNLNKKFKNFYNIYEYIIIKVKCYL